MCDANVISASAWVRKLDCVRRIALQGGKVKPRQQSQTAIVTGGLTWLGRFVSGVERYHVVSFSVRKIGGPLIHQSLALGE